MKTVEDSRTVERANQIACALESAGSPEAIAVLRQLSSQPRCAGDLAYNLRINREDVLYAVRPLCAAGVIELWGRDAWKLTLLGAELWYAIEPLLTTGGRECAASM